MQDSMPAPGQFVRAGGRVRMLRLGPEKPIRQRHNPRAPARRGYWAFPYPAFDQSNSEHKFAPLVPKALQALPSDGTRVDGRLDDSAHAAARRAAESEWIERTGRKVLPVRDFMYRGPLFAHFDERGRLRDDVGGEWFFYATAAAYFPALRKFAGRHRRDVAGLVYDVSALEVFLLR
jgi:hypothetical protein